MYDPEMNNWLHRMAQTGCLRKEQRRKMGIKIVPIGALTRPLSPKK